jgi:hypothetical protein
VALFEEVGNNGRGGQQLGAAKLPATLSSMDLGGVRGRQRG